MVKRRGLIFQHELEPATFNSVLRELYGLYLEPKEQAKYALIGKYRDKVSYRLIREFNTLHAKGLKQLNPYLRDLVYANNPFLALIPKSEGFSGKYVPVLIEYSKK